MPQQMRKHWQRQMLIFHQGQRLRRWQRLRLRLCLCLRD
jgi:hypothetical protein